VNCYTFYTICIMLILPAVGGGGSGGPAGNGGGIADLPANQVGPEDLPKQLQLAVYLVAGTIPIYCAPCCYIRDRAAVAFLPITSLSSHHHGLVAI
jgi:hypothetical protein